MLVREEPKYGLWGVLGAAGEGAAGEGGSEPSGEEGDGV
jgi:hypothetical protein